MNHQSSTKQGGPSGAGTTGLEIVARWLPFLDTIRDYDQSKFRADIVAAVTVALVGLPQAIAFALIVGVEPKYGIYALIVGSIVGALFGSSRHLHTGPVNASTIVIAATLSDFVGASNFVGLLLLLGLMSGLFRLLAGVLKLGNLSQFISRSVLVGLITGAAFLIIMNQIPNLLGLPRSTGGTVFKQLPFIFANLNNIQITSAVIGLVTLGVVVTLNRFSPKSASGVPYIPSYLLGLLAVAAVVAIFGLVNRGIDVVGSIPGVLPPLSSPALDLQSIRLLVASALALALIQISEAVACSKTIAFQSGDKVETNRELIGQGLANIVVAFFSGMPVSGSFARTTLNYRAGAQTRFAAVFSGVAVFVLVLLSGPITGYVPVAAIAGIIMVIAVQMINWKHIRLAFKTTRSDASVMVATFVSTLLFRLDTAIFIGVALSLVLFLRKAVYPRLIELDYNEKDGFQELKKANDRHMPEISIVHIEGDIFFGAADFLEEEIGKIARRDGLKVLILRMKSACCLDATSIMSLIQFAETMRKENKLLIVSGVTGEVERLFLRSGLDKVLGEENIFFSDVTVLKSTRQALGRALQHVNRLGEKEYRVRLFYDRPEKAKIPEPASKVTENSS